MTDAASRKKSVWSPTPEAFESLLAALGEDRERAGLEYVRLRRNLVRFFEGRSFPSAEEHADEVFNRVARKLSEGEQIEEPATYLYGVARLLMLEVRKEQARRGRALLEAERRAAQPTEADAAREHERHLECLQTCLDELEPDGRLLILEYYRGDRRVRIDARQQLAARLRLPQSALRSRAKRLREKLEGCVKRCLRKAVG